MRVSLLPVFALFLGFLQVGTAYAQCVVPKDNLNVNRTMALCSGYYSLPDDGTGVFDINQSRRGVLIINQSNIILDCNSTILDGKNDSTGGGVGIYNRG